jgi:Tol biopolymer transport system component/DNA-binding winged helix-turn-helix (wHTH) protein
MTGRSTVLFQFGDYQLTPGERLLLKNGEAIALPPKAFAVLALLVENAGELVRKRSILETVWPDSHVEESNIQVQISLLRKVLGETVNSKFIETVPTAGYRFIAPVTVRDIQRKGNELTSTEDTGSKSRAGLGSPPRIWKPKSLIIAVALILILSSVGYLLITTFSQPPRAVFGERIKLKKLTDSGSAFGAAISPNGKFVAFETLFEGKYAVSLLEMGSSRSLQITPPSENAVSGIIFTKNSEQIYFNAPDDEQSGVTSVYRIPLFGGEAKKVMRNTSSPVDFSPDGKRIVFIRNEKVSGESAVMTASADGGDETTIANRKSPDLFSQGKRPAWSPDGKLIACVGINSGEKFLRVLVIDPSVGSISNLTTDNWTALQDVVWQSDSDHLLVTAQDDVKFGPMQIWSTSISGRGAAFKITREMRTYVGLSLSSESLLTSQVEAHTEVWSMTGNGPANQILSIKDSGRVELAWTPDHRIVFTSEANGDPNIYVLNADGSNTHQITNDPFEKRSPTVSPDGRYIAFVSNRTGVEQLWRIGIDGQELLQLSADQIYRYPQFSSDGNWVVYSTFKDSKSALWKVPIGGGQPILVKADLPFAPNISPDMNSIAYIEKEAGTGRTMIKIVRTSDLAELRTWEVPANTPLHALRWTAESNGVLYLASTNKYMNLFRQPISDLPPTQLTDFKYDFPSYCAVAKQGKYLACLRNAMVRDVVQISPGE